MFRDGILQSLKNILIRFLLLLTKKYAYYIANKLEHLYPKDDIEVAEWMDGEINGSYNYMLKDVIDD